MKLPCARGARAPGRMVSARACALSLAALACIWVAAGAARAGSMAVDLELVLAVDVSGSVSDSEFDLQRSGYSGAFRNAAVQSLIAGSPNGVAVTVVYWGASGDASMGLADGVQEQKVGWTLLTSAADASDFADAIDATDRFIDVGGGSSVAGGATAVADAIDFSTGLFGSNMFDGARLVMDVSGDGFENVDFDPTGCNPGVAPGCVDQAFVLGPPSFDATLVYDDPDVFFGDVASARDAAVSAGITINGLPILLDHNDLDTVFYEPFVTGGPNSFLVTADDFDAFDEAVLQKISAELPEPRTAALLVLGLALLAARRRT